MVATLQQMRAGLRAAVRDADPGRGAADGLALACVDLFGLDGAAMSIVHAGASHGTFGASGDAGRRLDEYQFTFGEGPCLDAVAERRSVSAPDLEAPDEHRWPMFTDAVLGEGIRAVFALPIVVTSACVGALDLFRSEPGGLHGDQLVAALLAADLAATPLLHLLAADEARSREPEDGTAYDVTRSGDLTGMDRVEVYQATGMLVVQLDVDPAEAALRLRAHAMAHGLTASEVAVAIIEGRLLLHGDGRDDRADGGRS